MRDRSSRQKKPKRIDYRRITNLYRNRFAYAIRTFQILNCYMYLKVPYP